MFTNIIPSPYSSATQIAAYAHIFIILHRPSGHHNTLKKHFSFTIEKFNIGIYNDDLARSRFVRARLVLLSGYFVQVIVVGARGSEIFWYGICSCTCWCVSGRRVQNISGCAPSKCIYTFFDIFRGFPWCRHGWSGFYGDLGGERTKCARRRPRQQPLCRRI